MIYIGVPKIESNGDKSRIVCDIFIEGVKKNIWFEVEKKYEKYLCTERADGYLIGILNYAMRYGYNIECAVPVTEELMYNIKTILIPSLVKYSENLHSIEIKAKLAPALNMGEFVGTGCSCGIDSFSSIHNHVNTEFHDMDITHLCLNNVGAYNQCYADYGAEKVKIERYEETKKVAKELGIELIETDSNFASEIVQEHLLTHTYSSTFAIYMLQKMWKIYYYASSGLDYSHFSIEKNDTESCAHYELLSLQCFSIRGLKIYSEGGEKTRIEKTRDIANFSVAQKFLHVCLSKPTNCNVCSKCMRTLLSLDAIDKIDNFAEVFDIEYYKNNKIKYYKWLCKEHYLGDIMNEPVYQILSQRNEYKKSMFYYEMMCKIYYFLKKRIKK